MSETKLPNAVIVGIQLPKMNTQDLQGSLDELTRLVRTLGYNVVGQVTQKRSSEKYANVLGEGKLRELARWTGGPGVISSTVVRKKSKASLKWEEEDAEPEIETDAEDATQENSFTPPVQASVVFVDTDLSPSQLRNIESASGVTVLDRTGVIIEIFSRHAHTRAAKLQVEIAKLTYVSPRLREKGGGSERQGGGIGGKGAGETSLELDKRRIRDRIKELKAELAAVGSEHAVRRARRKDELTVALVGYTNAGKSSLMRAMTGSEVLVANKLFATLDTTIRPLYPETKPRVLLSDTVGFIKKLPHDLVASFKSTLDEATHASLLIYVVDSADPSFRSQLEVTKKVLEEVGAAESPSLLILNKKDCLTPEEQASLKKEFPEALLISTRSPEDLKFLRDKIMAYFETNMVDQEVLVPYTSQGVIGEIRSTMRVLSENYSDQGVTLKLRSTPKSLMALQKKLGQKSD